MTLFTRQDLHWLYEPRQGRHVSIYLPTHRAGAEQQQDPIRFKNLLRKADAALQQAGMSRAEAEAFLASGTSLLADTLFWQHQEDGLAVFITAEEQRHYRLPLRFGELVQVAGSFNISPLLPLLMEDSQFYVLSLSQNQVRLFQGTQTAISELDLADVPGSLAEVTGLDQVQKHLSFHTGTASAASAGGARSAVFHGHGGGIEDFEEEALLRYLRQIDAGLRQAVGAEADAPLVLAAVDALSTRYRQVSEYPNLLQTTISGNPDDLRADALHQRAWSIVEPHFAGRLETALARYRRMAGQGGQTAERLVDILTAAHHARIDTLFVVWGRFEWGTFDSSTNSLALLDPDSPEAYDLLNLAALQTLKHGGAVYAVDQTDLPENLVSVATLRF